VLIDPPAPASVLVVMAHPDDAEFSAGGTLAKWIRSGTRVTYCLCTNGDKGSADPTLNSAEVARIREMEQRAAAAVLGVADIVFLGNPDGALEATLELRRQVVEVIRRVRPEAVISPDPTRHYGPTFVNHPDHRAAGEAALAAVFPSARDPLMFPEMVRDGLAPHRVAQLFIANPSDVTCLVDISETIELKIAALREHRSQVTEERLRAFIPQRAAEMGKLGGLEAAEGFAHIALP
jgi:LmbE family N-acetylglucosaminyl deacetylase